MRRVSLPRIDLVVVAVVIGVVMYAAGFFSATYLPASHAPATYKPPVVKEGWTKLYESNGTYDVSFYAKKGKLMITYACISSLDPDYAVFMVTVYPEKGNYGVFQDEIRGVAQRIGYANVTEGLYFVNVDAYNCKWAVTISEHAAP